MNKIRNTKTNNLVKFCRNTCELQADKLMSVNASWALQAAAVRSGSPPFLLDTDVHRCFSSRQ